MVGANGDARDGTIGKDENGSNGVDVILNLGRNTLLVELVLLKIAGIGQPRRVRGCQPWNLGTLEEAIPTPSASSSHTDVERSPSAGRITIIDDGIYVLKRREVEPLNVIACWAREGLGRQ